MEKFDELLKELKEAKIIQLHDEWLPVQEDMINNEFFHDESKPVRRKNKDYGG